MLLALRCSLRRSHDSFAWRYLFRKTLVVILSSILSCKGFEIPGPLSCPEVLSLLNQFQFWINLLNFPAVREVLPNRALSGEKSSPWEAFGLRGGETNLPLLSVLSLSVPAMGTKWDSSGFVGFYHLANSDFCSKKIMHIPPHPQALIFMQVSVCVLLVGYLETKACAKGWYLMAALKGHLPVLCHSSDFIRFSSAVLTWLVMPWTVIVQMPQSRGCWEHLTDNW